MARIKLPTSDSCFAIFNGSSLDSSGDVFLIPGAAPIDELLRRLLVAPRRSEAESASRATNEVRT